MLITRVHMLCTYLGQNMKEKIVYLSLRVYKIVLSAFFSFDGLTRAVNHTSSSSHTNKLFGQNRQNRCVAKPKF